MIAGAAGRDFHNFNVVYRGRDDVEVVAFTATQIPDIDGPRLPGRAGRRRAIRTGSRSSPEAELERAHRASSEVDEVVFAYSDVTHEHVMHVGSLALAAGADYGCSRPRDTMLASSKPVVAICAVRTGSGKSQTTRHVAAAPARGGQARRRPPPPDALRRPDEAGRAALRALRGSRRRRRTIEEREEYEPHLAEGNLVFAGHRLRARSSTRAEQEADVIVWDGGNNDTPFIQPDLHIVVVDPHRPGHELRYHPGETNLRMADVCVVNKMDTRAARKASRPCSTRSAGTTRTRRSCSPPRRSTSRADASTRSAASACSRSRTGRRSRTAR